MRNIITKFTLIILTSGLVTTQAGVKKAKNLFHEAEVSQKTDLLIAKHLMKEKYYYSSLLFMKSYLAQINKLPSEETKERKQIEKMIELLILKGGTMAFSYMPEHMLNRSKDIPSIALALAVRYEKQGKHNKALNILTSIPQDHRFSPEARMMEGSANLQTGKLKTAEKAYSSCIKRAKAMVKEVDHEKMKRYYRVLNNTCKIHQARLYYQKKDYKKADQTYEEIPKTSYRWPYTLIEQAWTHYNLKDYNRSLGVLVTYKSPLLKSYFMPEAEVLRALNYFRLCLWGDAEKVIEHYYKYYNKKSSRLRRILRKHKSSNTFFLRLATTPISKNEDKNIFIRNLMTQISKKVKFNIDIVSYKRLKNEIKHVKKMKASRFKKTLLRELKEEYKFRTIHLNNYVKKAMYKFINDMHRYSYEMFNIKLEISSQKRDLVYENKKLVADRSRGDQSNVNTSEDEYFVEFTGEFCAYELSDYSFALKSNLGIVERDHIKFFCYKNTRMLLKHKIKPFNKWQKPYRLVDLLVHKHSKA